MDRHSIFLTLSLILVHFVRESIQQCGLIEVSGRDGFNDAINGEYEDSGNKEAGRTYWEKTGDQTIFIFWYPELNYWLIGEFLGSTEVFGYGDQNKDDPTEVTSDWVIWNGDTWETDSNVAVVCNEDDPAPPPPPAPEPSEEEPSPDPAPEPEPSPEEEPSPEPSPEEEPSPNPEPSPEPSPEDAPTPEVPSPEPEPSPEAPPPTVPEPSPETPPPPEPSPSPDDEPSPSPEDEPSPSPEDEPSPSPDDEPSTADDPSPDTPPPPSDDSDGDEPSPDAPPSPADSESRNAGDTPPSSPSPGSDPMMSVPPGCVLEDMNSPSPGPPSPDDNNSPSPGDDPSGDTPPTPSGDNANGGDGDNEGGDNQNQQDQPQTTTSVTQGAEHIRPPSTRLLSVAQFGDVADLNVMYGREGKDIIGTTIVNDEVFMVVCDTPSTPPPPTNDDDNTPSGPTPSGPTPSDGSGSTSMGTDTLEFALWLYMQQNDDPAAGGGSDGGEPIRAISLTDSHGSSRRDVVTDDADENDGAPGGASALPHGDQRQAADISNLNNDDNDRTHHRIPEVEDQIQNDAPKTTPRDSPRRRNQNQGGGAGVIPT